LYTESIDISYVFLLQAKHASEGKDDPLTDADSLLDGVDEFLGKLDLSQYKNKYVATHEVLNKFDTLILSALKYEIAGEKYDDQVVSQNSKLLDKIKIKGHQSPT
jgi:hypothetical protein